MNPDSSSTFKRIPKSCIQRIIFHASHLALAKNTREQIACVFMVHCELKRVLEIAEPKQVVTLKEGDEV